MDRIGSYLRAIENGKTKEYWDAQDDRKPRTIKLSERKLISLFCEYLGCHKDSIEGRSVKRFIKSKVGDKGK